MISNRKRLHKKNRLQKIEQYKEKLLGKKKMKKPNRRKTSSIGNVYKRIKKYNKEFSLDEKARLRLIKDFEVGEEVIIIHKKKEYIEKVLKINIKSYKISFKKDDYILINKESLIGFSNYIINERAGDGRRFVDENCVLKKINKDI